MHTHTVQPETAQHIVDAYLACWNAPDSDSRAPLIAEAWHDDARSADPLADVSGHAAIAEMMSGIQAQMPGHRFEQRGEVRAHHDVVHWGWAMCGPDGTDVLTGIDTAVVRDGRIASLYGFFDA
jgi:hypothetical protein